jgi:hypothetical protein
MMRRARASLASASQRGRFEGEMADRPRRNLPVLSLAARTSRRLISRPLLRFKSDTPPFEYGRAAACPRAAQKSAMYRSLRFLQWQPWCRRQAQ